MTVRERILALRLLGRLGENPEYARYLGVAVELRKKQSEEDENV